MSNVTRALHSGNLYLTTSALANRILRHELSPDGVANALTRQIEACNALIYLNFVETRVRSKGEKQALFANEPLVLPRGVRSALDVLFDFKLGWPASVDDNYTLRRNAYCAFRARIVKRYGPQRPRCSWVELIVGAVLSVALLATQASASELTPTAASPHQYKYCRYLTNGFIRVCEFDSMAQCKATSSRCERYPFLKYCHALNGHIQRCDFDTLAECEAASSRLPGDCERSPFMRSPEAPAPSNQKTQHSKGEQQPSIDADQSSRIKKRYLMHF
jgi:hypothetical protein